MAPTIRILSYGQGLVDNGCKVEVVVFQPRSAIMHILFQVMLEVLSTPMPIRGTRISPSYINFC